MTEKTKQHEPEPAADTTVTLPDWGPPPPDSEQAISLRRRDAVVAF